MANHTDHQEEQDQSRPFLASTEAHEATLMKEVKQGHHQASVDADDPAPMLPPIMNHTADSQPSPPDDQPSDPEPSPEPENHSQNTDSADNQPEDHESSHLQTNGYYPNSRRIVAGAVITLVALIGFSAAWYNVNQDIYTLGGSEDAKTESTKQAAKQPQPSQTDQPSTLGAETKAGTITTFKLANLPALSQGNYHLWAKQSDTTTSLGSFKVNDQGQAVTGDNQAFKPQLKASQGETILLISIETTDNPEQPSSTVILSGQLKDSKASLGFTAIDLSQASGVYTIAAPTDLSGEHQSSGIWFAKTDGHNLTGPGLSVPNAPAGWKYEAQLMYKDQVIAAGRFSNPNDRDDFGVFTPNPDQTPNFPGEDYLQGAPSRLGLDFPANLTSGEWQIIISIEPDQNGADPTGDDVFFLQPFKANIAQGVANYQEQELTLDMSKFPTAVISLN